MSPTAVFKDSGELTKGPSKVFHCWFQHFKKILNVRSIYNSSVLDALPVSFSLLHLDDSPTMAELEVATYV